MRSVEYEVIALTRDAEGEVVSGRVLVTGSVVLPMRKPLTVADVIFKHHDVVMEAGGPESVQVNIRTFGDGIDHTRCSSAAAYEAGFEDGHEEGWMDSIEDHRKESPDSRSVLPLPPRTDPAGQH